MRKQLRAQKYIEKDKSEKLKKREQYAIEYSYDNVFSYTNFIKAARKCLNGVYWKQSVQNYHFYSLTKTYRDYLSLHNRKLPVGITCRTIPIYERGKRREITPIHIRDRIIQKVLCDNCLTPIISKVLIYDNGASLPHKGVGFTRDRLDYHLRQAINEYGSDFYVLRFDFKSYFDSIHHSICREVLTKYIPDKEIVDITMEIIKQPYRNRIRKIKDKAHKAEEMKKLDNDEFTGICLGSQVSQVMALIVPNELDHYIKEKAHCKHYIRYMDDGIVLAKTKKELQELLHDLEKICDKLKLNFNKRKTTISKVNHGFTFLKVKYNVTGNCKIIKRLTHDGVVRMRRKLKKFRRKVDKGVMTIEHVNASMQSWLGHSKIARSYRTVIEMQKLYEQLFKKEMINNADELLQTDRWAYYRWCYQ